jgi:tRNA threonylcarbamoyladenosine biosynthesis protein TsaE
VNARTSSVDDTRKLAGELAGVAKPGDVILLAGDLGAGKTAFVQGFARALGVAEQVTSPTFTLVRSYEGRLPIVHVDVYRLDHLQEVFELGFSELLDEGAVALIEWGDMIEPVVPADFLEVRIELGEADDERHLHLRTVGPSWAPRAVALTRLLEPWAR